jgi:hypothetical protein
MVARWFTFRPFWSSLRSFGIGCGHLVYFSSLGPRKNWQPCSSIFTILTQKASKASQKVVLTMVVGAQWWATRGKLKSASHPRHIRVDQIQV